MKEFTAHHGKRYRAKLHLNFFESFGSNEQVAHAFAKYGFKDVVIHGSGDNREAEGTWTGPDKTVDLSHSEHVIFVEEISK
jgi:hypothetical protein